MSVHANEPEFTLRGAAAIAAVSAGFGARISAIWTELERAIENRDSKALSRLVHEFEHLTALREEVARKR